MKPLGRFRPEPPRRHDRPPFGFLVTACVAVIWVGLYGLFAAGVIDEQTLLVIVIVTAPVAFFPAIVWPWGKGLALPKWPSPQWPPIDLVVPWPLDDDEERRPRRATVARQQSRSAGPPNTKNP